MDYITMAVAYKDGVYSYIDLARQAHDISRFQDMVYCVTSDKIHYVEDGKLYFMRHGGSPEHIEYTGTIRKLEMFFSDIVAIEDNAVVYNVYRPRKFTIENALEIEILRISEINITYRRGDSWYRSCTGPLDVPKNTRCVWNRYNELFYLTDRVVSYYHTVTHTVQVVHEYTIIRMDSYMVILHADGNTSLTETIYGIIDIEENEKSILVHTTSGKYLFRRSKHISPSILFDGEINLPSNVKSARKC
jgi:hypothetical protein